MKKSFNNAVGESFSVAVAIVILSVTISLLAFNSEQNRITAFAILDSAQSEPQTAEASLKDFKNFNSLGSLSVGTYYIDNNGIIYSIDEQQNGAAGRVDSIEEIQKNRLIYVDKDGRVGYVLESAPVNEINER